MIKQELISTVLGMSEAELRELNSVIIEALNSRRSLKQQIAKAAFERGNKVTFTGKNGRPNTATILKINQKTIDVVIESNTGYREGMMVRVSPSMLVRI